MIDYSDKLKWSQELWERVQKDYSPYAVLVGLTTGGDSLLAFHIARGLTNIDVAFTCNTTIGAIETLHNCQKVCEKYHTKWICKAPPYGEKKENEDTYFELVKQHGFPGKTKTAHKWMYRYLKDHTIQSIVSSIKQRKWRPIVIISGARRHESIRRFGTSKDITVQNGVIWVNIINEWTDSECHAFSVDNKIDSQRSIISQIMGISGECFCGTYAQKNELSEIKIASPSTYNKIIFIQNWLRENTNMTWGWEESPPKRWTLEKQGQTNMFSPQMLMCSTCMNKTLDN